MIETHIKALTRIKENYERLWKENLIKDNSTRSLEKDDDIYEEYKAVCAGIEALENLIPQVCSVPMRTNEYSPEEHRMIPISEEQLNGGAKWILEHKGTEVMDTPLWVLISLGILAIEQEDSKDEV